MRTIKFRAWNTKTKIMTAPFEWYDLRVAPPASDDWELLQFTGLLDKNGREIYEGDILRLFLNTRFGQVIRQGQVKCEHLGSCFAEFTDGINVIGEGVELPVDCGSCEIIGNIFEGINNGKEVGKEKTI